MSQQLQLFSRTAALDTIPTQIDRPVSDSDSWLEQTRQLFQHDGSNSELMSQVMNAINALNQLCEQPKEQLELH